MPDLKLREMFSMGIMIIVLLWLGLYPQSVLDTAGPALEGVQSTMGFAASPLPAGPNGRVPLIVTSNVTKREATPIPTNQGSKP